MPGREQRHALWWAFKRGAIPIPTGRFRPAGNHASKIECTECGQAGWGDLEPDAATAAPWQLAHMMPHLYPCSCGMRFAAPWHLAIHISPRRWTPAHPDRGEHHWAVV